MLDMFFALQILMGAIFVIILLGKFIVLVSPELVQDAAVSMKGYDGLVALNYSPNSRLLYDTSAQLVTSQALVAAGEKKTQEKLSQHYGISHTKHDPELLNERRQITSDVAVSRLFNKDSPHIVTSEGQLSNRDVELNSVNEKQGKKGRVVALTKHVWTDIWDFSHPGFHNRIKDGSKGSSIASNSAHNNHSSKIVTLRKGDTSDMKNEQSLNKNFKNNSDVTTHYNLPINESSVENISLVNKIDNDAGEISHLDVGLSRRERQAPSSVAPTVSNRNIRAREEGDVIIGAIFPLHNSPAVNNTYSRQCGLIWETYGIQRVEAFLMTVESINTNPLILPHIKLGWDIRDSCWYSPIALENSIDFIKDAIASQSNINNLNPSGAHAPSTPSGPGSKLITTSSETVTTQLLRGNDSAANCRGNKNLKPIIGLVGPGSSEATIQVQNLLQIFNIPQIGYSATSHDLSDKNHYRYFLRVVPPDSYQAQALVDILLKCNWTYVSTVHSDDNYGLKGITEFTHLAKSKGICIAVSGGVTTSGSDEEYDNILAKLLEDQYASVVVCFCQGTTVQKLFSAIKRRRMERRLLIIGSDGWGNRMDVVTNQEVEAAGAISIMFHSPQFKDFKNHYENLKPHNNTKNPWFSEFWEEKFKCSLDTNNMNKYKRLCTGHESLVGSEEDSKLGFVVNAVTAMAVALQDMHQDLCPDSKGLCPAMEPVDGRVYLKYLQNVSFQSHSGEEIHFDQAGDPSAKYNILNYQPKLSSDGSTVYDYVTIGTWESGVLELDLNSIYWPQGALSNKGELKGIVKSVCAEPCNWDQAQVKVNSVLCCWICTDCAENAIVDNNTLCKECELGTWPNVNKTDCQAIPIDSIHWSHTQAIVSITVGSLGVCSTIWVLVIFIRHHDTPVVKASTRELSYIILAGICLAFSSNFILISKPGREICYLTRILPGLSFSLMYGALVTRTNRIARILEGSKRIMTKKPKFMSANAQLVIAFIIIGLEGAVITGMLLYQPADSRLDYSTPKKVRLICDTSTLGTVVPLGFDLVLIILCTIYAVKTRNLPENFNEAKFIGFAMYATCVIWLGFFPIYFAGDNKEITFSMSMSLSAAVALVLLFIPKVYVIVWVPEKNTRGAFTTSKDVRCHIGVLPMSSGDSIDMKESSTLDALLKLDKPAGRNWRQKSLDHKRLRFVMQRTAHSKDQTPYMNHGVLSDHTNSRNTSFLDRITKTNCKRDSPNVTITPSCPEQETLLSDEPASLSNAETARQNSARDFPLHKHSVTLRPGSPGETARQNSARDYPLHKHSVTLRPGSPAEKEKHRINGADRMVDLNQLLGMTLLHVPGRRGRLGDIRKSLSSTCVSSCPRVVSVQCQTTDDLVGGVLPPLRRRCVTRNKSILNRSKDTEDIITPEAYFGSDAKIHSHKDKRYIASLEVHESISLPAYSDCEHCSGISESAIHSCQICEDRAVFPVLDASEKPEHEDSCSKGYFHGHNSRQIIYEPYCQNNINSCTCRKSPCKSALVLITNPQRTNNPVEHSASSFKEKQNICDAYHNQTHNNQYEKHCQQPSLTGLEYNLLASVENPSEIIQRPQSKMSSASRTHQDSYSSSTASIVSSSSFTIPAFHSSTESNTSQQTFNDSLQSLDLAQKSHCSQHSLYSYQERAEFTDPLRNGDSELHGSKIVDFIRKPDLSSEDSDSVADDALEFHQYVQGHGL